MLIIYTKSSRFNSRVVNIIYNITNILAHGILHEINIYVSAQSSATVRITEFTPLAHTEVAKTSKCRFLLAWRYNKY